jgi:hypothetical protein
MEEIHNQEPICKRHQTIGTQLIGIRDEIESITLRVKLKKFETKNQTKKDAEIWVLN